MAFGSKGSRGRREAAKAPSQGEAPGLAARLLRAIVLPAEREALLRQGLEAGLTAYQTCNEARVELAFASFDEEMARALYEILYLLHVNDPRLSAVKYTVLTVETVNGAKRQREREETADLYLEGAPHGVQGFEQLSAAFRDAFWAHIGAVFGRDLRPAAPRQRAIASVHSIGSIGTVGHKSGASDLDLQVIYTLEQLPDDPAALSDQRCRELLLREREFWVKALAKRRGIAPARLAEPALAAELGAVAERELAKAYPNLTRYLVTSAGSYGLELAAAGGRALRIQCLQELIALLKRADRLERAGEIKAQEERLKERIGRIQRYISARYPRAEIYLFIMSSEDYRRGRYSSTLEFKESSGSAYELILNYETLMPGIQFTPAIPSHFCFPEEINSNPALFAQLDDYIRFGVMELYAPLRERLVNLGPAARLSREYVARHSGAAYWESFKASSGNLPKAILNLLRYEMLLEERCGVTVIQLIKNPRSLDALASPRPEQKGAWGWQQGAQEPAAGMAAWHLLAMESEFPKLLQDPWWLRFKALKIGFAEKDGVAGLDAEERQRVSRVLDLAFALHVRISDVFTKPGERRKFETHREQVLAELLERAFPEGSPPRDQVQQIFIGDVHAVNAFEGEMRALFKSCLNRVHKKIAAFKLSEDKINTDEFDLWYHYYQDNFDPRPNMIERSILSHLKVPRGRLHVGYRPDRGWFFKSLQRESGVGKRFDTFGILDHMPDEVLLQEDVGFLAGLAHCIINGYYDILNEGMLKETRTAIEFDGKHLDLGNAIHNTLAFMRPDQVERILKRILDHFPYQAYDYLDVIRAERRVTECLICFNLWHFGRVSILSRDNLLTYYDDEYEPEGLFEQAKALSKEPERFIRSPSLQVALGSFFDTRKILLDQVDLAVWVNPNSMETTHGAGNKVQKENELAALFLKVIREHHG